MLNYLTTYCAKVSFLLTNLDYRRKSSYTNSFGDGHLTKDGCTWTNMLILKDVIVEKLVNVGKVFTQIGLRDGHLTKEILGKHADTQRCNN